MTALVFIEFRSFRLDEIDLPEKRVLPYWIKGYGEALDPNDVEGYDDSGVYPTQTEVPNKPCAFIEGYFNSVPHFFSIWPEAHLQAVRDADKIVFNNDYPKLPWYKEQTSDTQS